MNAGLIQLVDTGIQSRREEDRVWKEIKEQGYTAHKTSVCPNGCLQCRLFRRAVNWPNGIPLLSNPAAHKAAALETLCRTYDLSIEAGKHSILAS